MVGIEILAESAVGDPLVQVSVQTRYSGHVFSRLSRGVPSTSKQCGPPPSGRGKHGLEMDGNA